MLGRHRGPRVVISGKTIVVSAINGGTSDPVTRDHGSAVEGDLVAWRSEDQGRSWSKPVVINDVPGSAQEGLHAMASAGGSMAAVWLDTRSSNKHLYGAYSRDGGAAWSKNVIKYRKPGRKICPCRDPSIAAAGKDRFEVMFRNVVQSARDMYMAGWDIDGQVSTAQKLGEGSWQINGCPMDGGGIAHRGNMTVTAWRRDHTVYLDEPGRPEIAAGEGKDVAVALTTRGPFVAWVNSSGVELYGGHKKETLCLSPAGSFSSLASLPNGSVLAAWEQDGKIKLQIVR